eukprot:TRINITY_DN104_c0_g1_i1.p1 TRINITY_DN104_c0_g1~~TRINITY_DN104_c0_g1_i1.p1  ORF type:complete len:293 (-),score=92.99 TRINITY_DN104_c0_g1_i1:122-1000(-)
MNNNNNNNNNNNQNKEIDLMGECEEFISNCEEDHFHGKRVTQVKKQSVLVIGKSQCGKSCMIRNWIAPNYTTKKKLYSDTDKPETFDFSIEDDTGITNVVVIDTPGLIEHKKKKDEVRNDEIILDLVSLFIQKEVTFLNKIIFVSKAGDVTPEDIQVFNKYLSYLTRINSNFSNISMFVVTNSEMLSSEELDDQENMFETNENLQQIREFCKLGYFPSGMIPHIMKNSVPDDIIINIANWRSDILDTIIKPTEPVSVLNIYPVVEHYKKDLEVVSRYVLDDMEKKNSKCVIS